MSRPIHTPVLDTPVIDNNALTASLRALTLGGMMQTLDARPGDCHQHNRLCVRPATRHLRRLRPGRRSI